MRSILINKLISLENLIVGVIKYTISIRHSLIKLFQNPNQHLKFFDRNENVVDELPDDKLENLKSQKSQGNIQEYRICIEKKQ